FLEIIHSGVTAGGDPVAESLEAAGGLRTGDADAGESLALRFFAEDPRREQPVDPHGRPHASIRAHSHHAGQPLLDTGPGPRGGGAARLPFGAHSAPLLRTDPLGFSSRLPALSGQPLASAADAHGTRGLAADARGHPRNRAPRGRPRARLRPAG